MMGDFNWVEARNNCTVASAFAAMRDAVQADMALRITQDETLQQRFEFRACNPTKFFVRKIGSHMIVFEQIRNGIKADWVHQAGEERALGTVTVGMNEQGECTLSDGKRELQSWQFRRIALEETLFGD